MSRTTARKHVFILVFQLPFHLGADYDQMYDDYVTELPDTTEADKQFIYMEYKGVVQNLDLLDGYISQYSSGWTIDRLNKSDLAILRLALYEILFAEIPLGATINEAVNLAKRYCEDDSPRFINGVLGVAAKAIQAKASQPGAAAEPSEAQENGGGAQA